MKTKLILLLWMFLPMAIFAQQLVSITPGTASNGQTLDVTITGTGVNFTQQGSPTFLTFPVNQGEGTITVGNISVNNLQILTTSTVKANITLSPDLEPGAYKYRINGVFCTESAKLNVTHVEIPPAPTLTAITPNTASNGQTLDVTITGSTTNFTLGSQPNLHFNTNQGSGTIVVNSVQVLSNTSIKANITLSAQMVSGDYSYAIDGINSTQSAKLHVNGVTLATINSVSPNVVFEGQTQNLTIKSQNSNFDVGNLIIDLGFGPNVGVNSYQYINETTLTINATFPNVSNSHDKDLSITSSMNGTSQKYQAYYINNIPTGSEPQFSISPASANRGQTLDVTITGVNTHFSQGSGTSVSLYIQGIPNTTIGVNNYTIINDTKIIANITIPNQVVGNDYTVVVYLAGGGRLELVSGFHVNVNNPFHAIVITTPTTTETGCDGKAEIHVAGGTAPYSYQLSNGSYLASTSNLCSGIYHALVMDANNRQVNIDFLISPPSGVLNSGNLPNSESLDTLYADYVNNCGIDYNELDSAYVRQITTLPDNRIEVTWTIVFGSSSINIRDIYEASTFTGIHDIVLRIFCPTRSVGQYITAQDRVDFDKFLSIKTQTLENVNVFPNPFNDNLTITLAATTSAHVTIVDITGKVVFNETFTDESRLNLDLSALEKGNYILKVEENNSVFTTKIVK